LRTPNLSIQASSQTQLGKGFKRWKQDGLTEKREELEKRVQAAVETGVTYHQDGDNQCISESLMGKERSTMRKGASRSPLEKKGRGVGVKIRNAEFGRYEGEKKKSVREIGGAASNK